MEQPVLIGAEKAAEVLDVSEAYMRRLVGEEALPSSGTGKDRLIKLDDVLAYRERRNAEREAALQEMVPLAEEAGFEY